MSPPLKPNRVNRNDDMKRIVFVHVRNSKEVKITRYDIFKFFEKYGKIKYLAMGERAEHFTGNCYITFEKTSSAEAATNSFETQEESEETSHSSNNIRHLLTARKYSSERESHPQLKHKADFLYSLDYFLTRNNSESLKCKFNYASMAKMFASVSTNKLCNN